MTETSPNLPVPTGPGDSADQAAPNLPVPTGPGDSADQAAPIEAAIILAAGFGQRLRPLTETIPKALLPVLNRPLLLIWLDKLRAAGVKRVMVNAHHLADELSGELIRSSQRITGLTVALSEEPEILGTGGGIKKAALSLFSEKGGPAYPAAFYVVNGDIHSDIDLPSLAKAHLARGQNGPPPAVLPPATLALVDRPRQATVSLNAEGKIIAFRAPGPVPGETARLCGAGIMVMSGWVVDGLKAEFSDFVDTLATFTGGPNPPAGLLFPEAQWADIGSIAQYYHLNRRLAQGRTILEAPETIQGHLSGFVLAQAGAVAEPGSQITDSILLKGALVERGAKVKGAVVVGRVGAGERLVGGVRL